MNKFKIKSLQALACLALLAAGFAFVPAAAHAAGTINVTDYNADGQDDADDTLAIRDAILALKAADGGTLYFPAGTYYVDHPGAGLGVNEDWLFPALSDSVYAGDQENRSVIKVRGGSTTGSIGLFHGNYVEDFTLRDLHFVSEKTDGAVSVLSLFYSHRAVVERNTFTNLVGYWNDPRFPDTAQPTGTTLQFGSGYNADPSTGHIVRGNTFTKAGAFNVRITSPYDGVEPELAAVQGHNHGHQIVGNTFRESDYSAIEVIGPTTHDVLVQGNHFYSTNGPAIDFDKGSYRNTADSNTIVEVNKTLTYEAGFMSAIELSQVWFQGKNGLVVYSSHDNTVSNNKIDTRTADRDLSKGEIGAKGIRTQGSYNDKITGNTIISDLYGISLQSVKTRGTSRLLIQNNEITAGDAGIKMLRTVPLALTDNPFADITIDANTIHADNYGIHIEEKGKSDLKITNNTIRTTKEVPISAYSVQGIRITGNSLTADTAYKGGVYLNGCNTLLVQNNNIQAERRFITISGSTTGTVSGNTFTGTRHAGIPEVDVQNSTGITVQ